MEDPWELEQLLNLGPVDGANGAEGGDGVGGVGNAGEGEGTVAPQAGTDPVKYTLQNPDGTYTEVTQNGQAHTYDQNGQLRSSQSQQDYEQQRFSRVLNPHDSQEVDGQQQSSQQEQETPKRSWRDIRKSKRSGLNFGTDVTQEEFEKELTDQGWQKVPTRTETVWRYVKDQNGKSYSLRPHASSWKGWTVDVFGPDGRRIMEIRLDWSEP